MIEIVKSLISADKDIVDFLDSDGNTAVMLLLKKMNKYTNFSEIQLNKTENLKYENIVNKKKMMLQYL